MSMSWFAESYRCTLFPTPLAKFNEFNWWEEITGKTPEDKRSQLKLGIIEVSGPLSEDKNLILRIEPFRIDWYLTPPASQNLPSIGPFPETLEMFFELMKKWFKQDTCPSAQRLAFGINLSMPVKGKKEGYKILKKYLSSVELDPEKSSEFLYQINRPRSSKSKIKSLQLNRLSRWSVGTLTLTLDNKSGQMLEVDKQSACRLELDLNTDKDYPSEFNRNQYSVIFKELIDLGIEISENGDKP